MKQKKQAMQNYKENRRLLGVRGVRGVWSSASLPLVFTARMIADEQLYMPERHGEKTKFFMNCSKFGSSYEA